MSFKPNLSASLLILTVILVLLPVETYAFGAGDIPDFAFLNDKAFRHGDIENVLENLAKTAGRVAIGGSGILGIAASVIKAASGPSKFNKGDVKKVYFGNWLRDYSQAMDIAGLSKLSADTLVIVVSVLGFMTFGYSTQEFQVTADRLGVYLPVEHIDNPKGYAEKEGDARRYHQKLRPPVDRRELEIDPKTGMKNYMATEGQGWDTSTAFIRRTFRACIEIGRRANGQENADLWEAYRLLGTGLHTMEDLLAHSNWCEVALRKMGYNQVFCHVGDKVIINTPNGPAPPLVTGTFGSADFLHSLLGEAGDKISQASVTDLSNKINEASQGGNNSSNVAAIKALLGKIMGGSGSETKLSQGEQIQAQSQAYHFDPNNVAPPEVQKKLLELLKWHDDVMREIVSKIQMVPGLTALLEEFTNALNAYIYTILAPYLTPILSQATAALNEGSKEVINNEDQYEVFDNARASDPSHSLLSKDHFGLILNEPAGKIAQIVVEHSVNLIVQAWSDNNNPDRVIDQILEAFHHPYYATGRSEIQHKMFILMQAWLGGLGPDEAKETIQALTKESVRNHKNKRLGSEDQDFNEPGYAGCSHGSSVTKSSSGGKASSGYSASKPQSSYGAEYGSTKAGSKTQADYGGQQSYGQGREETSAYARQESTVSGRQQGRQEAYDGGRQDASIYSRQETPTYGRQEAHSSKRAEEKTYGDSNSRTQYGQGRTQQSYGSQPQGHDMDEYDTGRTESYDRNPEPVSSYGQGYGSRPQGHDKDEYDTGRTESYGRNPEPVSSYGQGYGSRPQGHDKDEYATGRTESYGRNPEPVSSYGQGYGSRPQGHDKDEYDTGRTESYGRNPEPVSSYGQGYGSRPQGRDNDEYDTGRTGSYGRNPELVSSCDTPQHGGHREGDSLQYESPYRGQTAYSRSQTSSYGASANVSSGYGRLQEPPHQQNSPKRYDGGGRNNDDDDKSRKYGGDDDKPQKYAGGGYKHGEDDKQTRYSGKPADSDDEPKKYGGHRSYDSDDKANKHSGYGRNDDSDDDKKARGKKNRDNDSGDDLPKKNAPGGREQYSYGSSQGREPDSERGGYGGGFTGYGTGGGASRVGGSGGYGAKTDDDNPLGGYQGRNEAYGYANPPGYAPSYGSNRNDTFGAERMKISQDSDDDSDKRKHGGRRGY